MDTKPGSTLAESAASALRAKISSGQWPVGSRIPIEPELSALLGVGRSTVREAVQALTRLGMLEPLTARGTFVRSATPAPSILADALSAYAPAELIGLRRALDMEAAQTAAAQHEAAELERLEAELNDELSRLRSGDSSSPGGSHCARFHSLIAQTSGNRLVIEMEAGLSAAMRANGLEQQLEDALDVAICINQHDRIFTAIRGRDVGAAAHHMAIHADAMLRSLSHDPIVTDLTALMRAAEAEAEEPSLKADIAEKRPRRRGIA